MDSFADTLNTAIAAIQCGRRVIVFGKDIQCFCLATSQLWVVAASIQKQLDSCTSSDVLTTVIGRRVRPSYAPGKNMESEEEGGVVDVKREQHHQLANLTETKTGEYTTANKIGNKNF